MLGIISCKFVREKKYEFCRHENSMIIRFSFPKRLDTEIQRVPTVSDRYHAVT